MIIKINDEVIDFSLDNETILKEVVNYLVKFLDEQGCVITSLKVNSEDMLLLEALESIQQLNSVQLIDFKVIPYTQEIKYNLSIMVNYIDNFLVLVNNSEQFLEHKQNLPEEFLSIIECLKSTIHLLSIDSNHLFLKSSNALKILNQLDDNIKKLQDNMYNSTYILEHIKPAYVEILTQIKDDLIPLIIYYKHFFNIKSLEGENLEEVKEILNIMLDSVVSYKNNILSTLTMLFTEGKDKEAIDLIQDCIHVYDFLRLVRIKLEKLEVLEKHSLQALDSQILEAVQTIVDSLEENDIITVNDIIDYEYLDKIQEYIKFLKENNTLHL